MLVFANYLLFAQVETYPSDYSNTNILKSDIYEVTVRQVETSYPAMVYKSQSNGRVNGGRNSAVHNNSISWTNFSFSGTVTVQVKLLDGQNKVSYGTAKIFPSRRNITPVKINNTTLEFTISSPGQFSVEFSDTAYEHGLMVFADPMETRAAPSGADVKICNGCSASDLNALSGKTAVFFKDAHHDIGIWEIPPAIKEIYIEGGAVVEGALHLKNTGTGNDNTLIHGRGILDGRKYYDADPDNKKHGIESFNNVSGTTVEGITVSQAGAFFVRLLGTNNTIDWVKTIGGWIFNNDGFVGYQNTTITNCFVWANDDGIKLYRDNQAIENITAWHLTNGGVFQWCWNTVSAKNIRVKNVDIIRGQWPGDGRNQGVFNIRGSSANNGLQEQTDWVFEDIYIDNPVKVLFNLAPQVAHNVNNMEFNNIHAKTTPDVINRIKGFNASNKLDNIRINNLTINGTCIDDNTKNTVGNFEITNATNINFSCQQTTPSNISDLAATATSCDAVSLTWSDTNGETAYRVRRKLPPDAAFTNLADVGANVTSYTDNSVSASTTYIYQVRPVVNGTAVAISNQPPVTTPGCVTTSIVITGVTTNCNGSGNARNIISFSVSGSNTMPTVNQGTILDDGNGNYRVRDIGIAFGSTTNYTISVGGTSVDQPVTAVPGCGTGARKASNDKGSLLLPGEASRVLYPNPVQGILHLQGLGVDGDLYLVNVNGTVLKKVKGQKSLDMSTYLPGIYFLKTGQTTWKIIKQ